jgi:carboxymethylenebutenolidase
MCPQRTKKVAVDIVVVVQFRGDKLACERIYWDHAAVLRQVGLLPT